MRLSDWIRKIEEKPIVHSQTTGLTVISLMGVAVFLYAFFTHGILPDFSARWAEKEIKPESVAVEIEVDDPVRGIHFVPFNTTIGSLLNRLGIEVIGEKKISEQLITPGMKIKISNKRDVTVEEMAADKRLALGIPLDVNRASLPDLMLVPGLGEKTASAIIAFRSQQGGKIKKMEDLLQVPGIKEKKLASLKKFLVCR
ncbi:MAG: helix-hairpin-helix domain-containing protein [Syntrophales bacterium]|nr:helix-hairpin-helix domain-containing protein [Syntrophales bacterium]